MPTVQPSTSLSKKADMGMKEIIRGMRDLQIKLARLEENTSINNLKNVSKQGYVQRCIWCDDASHTRKDCNEFNNMIRHGIICWKDGKIALKDREDLLQTNFGKGRMRALVQDYLKEHETVVRESASYGARVDDEIGGSTETSEFWASVVSTMQEGKLPREALLRIAATIRGRTGWEDPVESLLVHAYIAKSQHEALMEEKRRGNFDDTREGNSFNRQTQGDKAREATSQELPEHQPTPVQILSGQVQALRYSQSGHTEMLRSIPITGVSRKRKTNSHDGFEEPIGSNFDNPIRILLSNMRPELARRLNVTQLREHPGYYGHLSQYRT
uniref:Predicted protein n=1 Tax=Physcomitrium patens TaxID=3218 RepID=A9U4C6_PHYPA